MRAVWYDRQGAADEVLVCGELPMPEAGDGEVRVKLEASGVNPSDTYRRRGPPPMEYPRVVTNSDGAGPSTKLAPVSTSGGSASACGFTTGSATADGWVRLPSSSRCPSIW